MMFIHLRSRTTRIQINAMSSLKTVTALEASQPIKTQVTQIFHKLDTESTVLTLDLIKMESITAPLSNGLISLCLKQKTLME